MQNRPLRAFEQGAHLHVLDWAHERARQRFQTAGAAQVNAAARAVAGGTYTSHPPELPALEAALHGELHGLYALGHATVRSELAHQARRAPLPIGVEASPRTLARLPDLHHLRARARLAAAAVAHSIHQVIARARLQGIDDTERLQALGREAGDATLRAQASQHAGGAISAGRQAGVVSLLERRPQTRIAGARYTAVLDANSCGPCTAADDGVLRSLDDPVLVRTPNPACLGGSRCRCIWVYQLSSEPLAEPLPIAAAR